MKWAGRLFFLAAGLLGALAPAFAQDKQPPIVSVAPVEGIIDLGLAPFIQRVLDEAAVQIRDALLNPRLPVEVIYILVFIGILLFQYLMKRFGPPPPQEPAQEEHPAPFAEEVNESAWGSPASRAAIEPARRSDEPAAPAPLAGRRFTRRALLGSRREVQNAIVIAAILGPCRAFEPPARNPQNGAAQRVKGI